MNNMPAETGLIPLSGECGKLRGPAIVDAADIERLSQYTWWVQVNKAGPYAYTWAKDEHGKIATPRRKLYMHRLVAATPPHLETDHRNSNGLDNRRSNLRNVPQSVNGGRPRYGEDAEYEAYVEEQAARAEATEGAA